MPKTIKLKLNAASGKIELHCPEEFFETAMEQCIKVIDAYPYTGQVSQRSNFEPSKTVDTAHDETGASDDLQVAEKPKEKPKRSRKPPNYTPVDLGLSDEQARELRSFFSEKKPRKQNDIVCVVACKLKEFLGKDVFTVDEIFSGIRFLEAVKVPKNLSAVFRNTANDGNGIAEGNNFTANFATDDHVRLKLPEVKD